MIVSASKVHVSPNTVNSVGLALQLLGSHDAHPRLSGSKRRGLAALFRLAVKVEAEVVKPLQPQAGRAYRKASASVKTDTPALASLLDDATLLPVCGAQRRG